MASINKYQQENDLNDVINLDDQIFIFDNPIGKMGQLDQHNQEKEQQFQFSDLNNIQDVNKCTNDFDQQFHCQLETAPQSGNKLGQDQSLPKITRDSGYYSTQKKKPKKAVQQKQKQNIKDILNYDDDVGEVGEWVEHRANETNDKEDEEFDVFGVQPVRAPAIVKPRLIEVIGDQERNSEIEPSRPKQSQKRVNLSGRQGAIVNNLKEKAKSIALQNNNKINRDSQNLHQISDIENEEEDEEDDKKIINDFSPDKKLFQIQQNSLERQLSSRSLEKQHSSRNLDVSRCKQPIDLWATINEDRLREIENAPKKEMIRPILFIEAWDCLKSDKLLRDSIKEQRSNRKGFFERYFACFSVQLKTIKLKDEMNQILHLAQTAYIDGNDIHFRILYTIYCQFVNTDFCQRYGSHWESIGFQGRDPATDLRGTGILGLLQILALLHNYNVQYHFYLFIQKEYIRECLEFSKQPQSQLPLCVTLINISLFCIQALRDDRFNSLINKEDSVLSVINKVYFAAWYFFFQRYKQVGGQIDQIGQSLREIKTIIYDSPGSLVEDFKASIKNYYKNKQD